MSAVHARMVISLLKEIPPARLLVNQAILHPVEFAHLVQRDPSLRSE